jgi:hypothetical protein
MFMRCSFFNSVGAVESTDLIIACTSGSPDFFGERAYAMPLELLMRVYAA